MKKTIFLFLALSLTLLNSCTKNESKLDTQSDLPTLIAPDDLGSGISCPPGTHPIKVYEFDAYKFHRPKYQCQSGFWFCRENLTVSIQCVPNESPYWKASIKENIATFWAKKINANQVEIHFPIGLKNLSGYTPEDLATFNVDSELEMDYDIKLKIGEYQVTETEDELVVIVDLL